MLNQKQMEEAKSTMLDYKEVVDKYVKVEDWRVKKILRSHIRLEG